MSSDCVTKIFLILFCTVSFRRGSLLSMTGSKDVVMVLRLFLFCFCFFANISSRNPDEWTSPVVIPRLDDQKEVQTGLFRMFSWICVAVAQVTEARQQGMCRDRFSVVMATAREAALFYWLNKWHGNEIVRDPRRGENEERSLRFNSRGLFTKLSRGPNYRRLTHAVQRRDAQYGMKSVTLQTCEQVITVLYYNTIKKNTTETYYQLNVLRVSKV